MLNGDNAISVEQVDWTNEIDKLGFFDLIIGSDLLYEDSHIQLLANFIEGHSNPSCEVIIVDPGRGRKNKLSAKMLEFGFTSSQQKPAHTDYLEQESRAIFSIFER